MTGTLGIPEQARGAWLDLHDAITDQPYPTPCQGPDAGRWYGGKTNQEWAVTECAECPVVALCGTYALKAGESFGVWGGMTEKHRATITRKATR